MRAARSTDEEIVCRSVPADHTDRRVIVQQPDLGNSVVSWVYPLVLVILMCKEAEVLVRPGEL